MAEGTLKVHESIQDLEARAAAATSKSVTTRLTVLKLYALFSASGEDDPATFVAQAVGLKVETVEKWLSVYRQEGIDALLAFGRRVAKGRHGSKTGSGGRASSTRRRNARAEEKAPNRAVAKSFRKSRKDAATPMSKPTNTTPASKTTSKKAREDVVAGVTSQAALPKATSPPDHGRLSGPAPIATGYNSSAMQSGRPTLEPSARSHSVAPGKDLPDDDHGDSFAASNTATRNMEADAHASAEVPEHAARAPAQDAEHITDLDNGVISDGLRSSEGRDSKESSLFGRMRVRYRASRRALARRSNRAFGTAEKVTPSNAQESQQDTRKPHPTTVALRNDRAVMEGDRDKKSGTANPLVPPPESRSFSDEKTCVDDAPSTPVTSEPSASALQKSTRPAYTPNRKYAAPSGLAFAGTRVLIAEPDDLITDIIKHRFEKQGAHVISASDGMEVVSRFWSTQFDLVILAVALPGLDGFEIARWLRGNENNENVPILITSWPGNESDLVRAFDSGADDFLRKPFSPLELIARTKRLMERARSSTGHSQASPTTGSGAEDV